MSKGYILGLLLLLVFLALGLLSGTIITNAWKEIAFETAFGIKSKNPAANVIVLDVLQNDLDSYCSLSEVYKLRGTDSDHAKAVAAGQRLKWHLTATRGKGFGLPWELQESSATKACP